MERDGAVALSADRAEQKMGGETTGRRNLLKHLTTASLVAGLGCLAYQFGRFLKPNVLYEPPKSFKLGRVEDFALGSRTVIEAKQIEVVRKRDGLYVISLVCTHLGCVVGSVSNDPKIGYVCACHGSKFTHDGDVRGGPAPRALPWYKVYKNNEGILVVNTAEENTQRTKLAV